MKDCEDFRTLMAEALLGELAPEDKACLESHLAACPSCAGEYEGLRETLRLMDKRERPDPGGEFWDGYWGRLMDRLEKETPGEMPAVRWWRRLAAQVRAREYLDRSKLVILALVNYNPATEDSYALDLPLQKKISRQLVSEAGRLRADLKAPRERRLRELVSDLETIFIQIANLESENDLEAVEFIKQGVAARGVLLKINLSEMKGKPDKTSA